MPNIAINNYCNLKCPYCFAEDMKAEDKVSMNLNTLQEILDFSAITNARLGIIGGEPTLHPQFKEILKLINKQSVVNNENSVLFTNGIELEKFLPYIGQNMTILLNYNSKDIMTESQWNKLQAVLEHINELGWFENEKVILGCNIHLDEKEYKYFWDTVKKYNIKVVRASVVSPGGKYICLRNNRDNYYENMKSIFLDFVFKAKENNCYINMDCSKIPNCYFNDMELDLIDEVCRNSNRENLCKPCVDITSDLTASPCFGTYNSKINIKDFNNEHELYDFLFLKKMYPKEQIHLATKKCLLCEEGVLLKCSGGCLAFEI